MPYMRMEHEIDPKEKLLNDLGDISGIEIFNNQILLAVYIRPEKTITGVYMPDKHREEDKYQSKIGLLVKAGSSAFKDDSGAWFKDANVQLHDWLISRPTDGWSITIHGVLCRIVEDNLTKGRVPHPDDAW